MSHPTQSPPAEPGICPRCDGFQYVTDGRGAFAKARACSCVSTCTYCGGDGYELVRDDQGYEVVRRCRCNFLDERIARYNSAHLPSRYHRCSLESYEERGGNQRELKYFLLKYQKSFQPNRKGLVLIGNPGTGKTHLLVSLLAHFTLERGIRCRYIDFMSLLSSLKEGFDAGRSETAIIGPIVDVPVLVVDELGKGKNTEWEHAVLDEIISQRYNAERTTMFATNYQDSLPPLEAAPNQGARNRAVLSLQRQTLEDRVGPRIYSRLREMCEFRTVVGPDSRRMA